MTETLQPTFVTTIPDNLDPGVIYVSMSYATATHLCACGCDEPVVTPIAPDGWTLTYNGVDVSLDPSIGNWRFECRSHYWLTDGEVRWAPPRPQPSAEPDVPSWWGRVTGWFKRFRRRLWQKG